MATLRKYGGKYNSTFCQLCGLSTDTKPTSVLINDRSVGLADGSEFIEMDTNKKYKYSADNATWYEVESGGGGGGSATLIDKTITANGIYNATDDGANGYKSVDVNVPVTGIPKLVSPSSLVEALKKYECAHIHNIGEENRGRISLTVVRGETWVSAPSVVKCYGVATFPVRTITFTNDSQYYENCTIIFTADSSNILAEYFDGATWNTINWGRSFTVGKVYRADFNITIIQGNVKSIVVNAVTEYDEPISFTVE